MSQSTRRRDSEDPGDRLGLRTFLGFCHTSSDRERQLAPMPHRHRYGRSATQPGRRVTAMDGAGHRAG
jgi:hypothetical protein